MKKTILPLFLLAIVGFKGRLPAQVALPAVTSEKLRVYDNTGTFERFEPGTPVSVEGFSLRPVIGNSANLRVFVDGTDKEYLAAPKDGDKLDFDFESLSLEQIWELAFLRSEALEEVGAHGWDYDIRRELDGEYAEMEQQFSFLTDPFLHDYLNRLLIRAFPGALPEGHPGRLHVRLIQSPSPQAFATANGAIYISTGMLATLGSEAELMAILAQEVAHIVLDHSVVNFRKVEQREARAQFWAGLLTAAAAVAETAAATNAYKDGYDPYLYYNFGGFTESVALLAFSVAHEITARLGMEYTSAQNMESARAAAQVLNKLGYEESALPGALFRIRQYYKDIRDYQAMRQDNRMGAYGAVAREYGMIREEEIPPVSLEYTRKISLANLITASGEFAIGRYGRARELAQRNVDAGVAVPEDLILLSAIQRRTTDSSEGMDLAMVYLDQAEKYARSLPNEFYIEKALVQLRRGRKSEARAALETYRERDPYLPVSSEQESALQWWVRNMLEKVERM